MTELALAIAIAALALAAIALLHSHTQAEARRREYRQLRGTIETNQRRRELGEHLIPTNGKRRP